MSDVGSRVRSGVKLTFITTIISGLVQAVLLVVLARLLAPLDYGYYAAALAIANVTVALVNNVIERSLVIHVGEEAPAAAIAALVLLCSLGVALLTFAGATTVAALTRWTMPGEVLGALLVAQVINSLAIVPRVNLRRQLLFRPIVFGELASQLIGGALVSIVLAAAGWGALGLALAQVVGSVVTVVAVTAAAGLRIAPFTAKQAFTYLAAALSLARVVALEIANAQIPPLILTALAGPIPLGLFNRAYTLVQLPVQLLTNSMTRVMISALVTMVDDEARLRNGMRRLVTIASAIVSPVAFGIAGSHQAFTAVLLGPKWMAAATLMPWLAIGTWTVMMGYLFSVLSEATRHFGPKIRLQSTSSLVLALGLLLYVPIGLAGAAIGMALGGVTFLLLYIALGADILRLPYRTLAGWLTPGLVAGLVCCAGSWAVGEMVTASPYILLALQIGACGTLALAFYALFHRGLLGEIAGAALPVGLTRRFAR